jgi:hypothetical protein
MRRGITLHIDGLEITSEIPWLPMTFWGVVTLIRRWAKEEIMTPLHFGASPKHRSQIQDIG